ncbi:MAG: hypothetical protein D3926_20655, partial [Desulfobacteraceae bacterium]
PTSFYLRLISFYCTSSAVLRADLSEHISTGCFFKLFSHNIHTGFNKKSFDLITFRSKLYWFSCQQ